MRVTAVTELLAGGGHSHVEGHVLQIAPRDAVRLDVAAVDHAGRDLGAARDQLAGSDSGSAGDGGNRQRDREN